VLQAVLFDLDDTLFPERSYVASGFRAVAAWVEDSLGIPQTEAELDFQRLFEEGVRGHVFDRWLQARGLEDDELMDRMVWVYRSHQPQIFPHRGAIGLLMRLRSQYRLGLLSDGDATVQRKKLRVLQMRPMFDTVLFTDELGREAWKPSPRPFEVVLGRLRIKGSEAVYVADNPEKDFLGSRRAGMLAIRVRLTGGIYSSAQPPTPEHAPDHEIRTLRKLESLLTHIRVGSSVEVGDAV
jgi:putative hydrolase of the HAD superfamily